MPLPWAVSKRKAIGQSARIFDGRKYDHFGRGTAKAVITTTKGGEKRSIKEPENQQAFRGSREGFIESLDTNISLVRRIIKTRIYGLKNDDGKRHKTDVAIMYINGVCDPKTVKEVKKDGKH